MHHSSILSKSAVSVSIAALLLSAGAHAQVQSEDTGASVAEKVESTRRLGAITVTAQKREQSLQDVPIVVTALSGELLSDAGVQDIKDLTVVTPGLLVTSSSKQANTTARIRGLLWGSRGNRADRSAQRATGNTVWKINFGGCHQYRYKKAV